MKDEKPKQSTQDSTQFNQLVSFLVGGVMFGFIVALYLGAFSGKDYENLSDWFAVLIAAIAAGISGYAVYLVAQTLKPSP